jgi:hypothetical protein
VGKHVVKIGRDALDAFLISQEGEWINGQVINIDGATVLR